jgi:amidohydrolase
MMAEPPAATGTLEEMKARVQQRIFEVERDLIGVSRALHDTPETAWNEHASAALLAVTLEADGFRVEKPLAGLATAFRATAGNGRTPIAVVAEYDALAGLGHACGHNIIAAAAVGAALGLRPLLDDLDVTLHVIGSPAEEGGGGKIVLLDAGVFDGLAAAMMIHPGPENRAYAYPFAVAHFDVRYTGIATHAAAYPSLGVNAADAFVIAQTAIGLLRQQLSERTRVHGVVISAGTAANIIPAESAGYWYVRAETLAELNGVFEKVRRCFEAGALATGCTLELTETSGRYADFVNDQSLLESFAANSARLGRHFDLNDHRATGMNTASTDMGNVSQIVPSIHPYLGIESAPAVNHQREFAEAAIAPAADRALIEGATALAWTVADVGWARSARDAGDRRLVRS